MPEEKRRYDRIFFDMPAELTAADKVYAVKEIANLSVGGCLMEIDAALAVGTPCEIKILVDGTSDGLAVQAEGKIIRTGNDAVVIEFTRIDPAHLTHLKNIVKYSLPLLRCNPENRARMPSF